MKSTNILSPTIADCLLMYVTSRYRTSDTPYLSISRLEEEVFGGISSSASLAFWHDCHEQLIVKGELNKEVALTLFCLFMAMTNDEIGQIRDSYFKNWWDRVNTNRSAI